MHRAGPADPPIHVDDVEVQEVEVGELAFRRRRLGAAAGAHRLGVGLWEVPPGRRLNPPHSHADEEEVFVVLAGGGLSYQSSGSRDARTYRVGVGDALVHHAGGDAHTMVAGDEGLTVLVLAEGSRTNITWLPRARQFWLGPRWSPGDAPPPFRADHELGPLALPEPTPERPSTIVALADCPLEEGGEGRFRWATRDASAAAGAHHLVLARDDLPPGSVNCPSHWHTVSEEAFYVVGGSGTARIGRDEHPLRPGSFLLRPPASAVGHRLEAGPDGLSYLTLGDRPDEDVCFYPDSRKLSMRRGPVLRYADVPYFADEPDATAPWPAG